MIEDAHEGPAQIFSVLRISVSNRLQPRLNFPRQRAKVRNALATRSPAVPHENDSPAWSADRASADCQCQRFEKVFVGRKFLPRHLEMCRARFNISSSV
jgi:hypothetical protein